MRTTSISSRSFPRQVDGHIIVLLVCLLVLEPKDSFMYEPCPADGLHGFPAAQQVAAFSLYDFSVKRSYKSRRKTVSDQDSQSLNPV